jgi:hypothetical protein
MTKSVTLAQILATAPVEAYPVLFYSTRNYSTPSGRSIANIFLQTDIIYKN